MSKFFCGAALCALASVSQRLKAEDLDLCLRGWDATEAHDDAHAIALYEACMRQGHLSPASLARTYRNIGITYRHAGEPERATAAFDHAIALRPDDVADDYIDRGNARDEAGNFEQALVDYAKALDLQPGYGEAYYNRGIAYERHRRFGEARSQFIEAYNHGLRTDLLYERLRAYGLIPDAR